MIEISFSRVGNSSCGSPEGNRGGSLLYSLLIAGGPYQNTTKRSVETRLDAIR
jgi:hypothetical protein